MTGSGLMRAIAIRESGGPEVLQLQELELPRLGGGDLLVRVQAAGVNFIDTYHRSGVYPVALPFVPGMEGAGLVEAVGDQVEGFEPGDRVAWAMSAGAYAEFAAIPAAKAVRVPEAVPSDLAAASMLQGMTAHYLVNSVFEVTAEHTVLVHAAAGGVGLLLCQLAKAKGARVLATASTEAKRDLARQAGADVAFGYEDFTAVARELTRGRGVDVVFDGVGAATFDGSLASLRPRGLLALFGGSSGQVPPFDVQRLNAAGSLFLTRPTLGHYLLTREELQWRAGDILNGLADGSLVLRVHNRYALADAAAAHRELEARLTTGKVLLLP